MPRITKKQKEAWGGAGKPRSKDLSAGGEKRKRGFQVGPAHAPKDAYLGKVKKIKQGLVERAKMKKSYAKLLKSEGMRSDRVQDRAAPRPSSPSPQDPQPEASGSTPPPRERAKHERRESTSKGKGKKREGYVDTPREPPVVTAAGQVRALSPERVAPVGNPAISHPTSLRTMKRDAYGKYHDDRRQVPSGGSVRQGGQPLGGSGTKRGQPNMGARMGVLLEKLQRGK